MLEKEIAAATEWWADKVCGLCKFDNGDDSSTGGVTAMLATLAKGSAPRPDEDQRAKFVAALSEIILKEAVRHTKAGRDLSDFRMTLDVDYGPCCELSDAADVAGITGNQFPWKTVMWIHKGDVAVRYGYGADETPLYLDDAGLAKRVKYAREQADEYTDPNSRYRKYYDDEEAWKKMGEKFSARLTKLQSTTPEQLVGDGAQAMRLMREAQKADECGDVFFGCDNEGESLSDRLGEVLKIIKGA